MTARKGHKSHEPPKMPAGAFKRWRKSLGLSQKEAAHALGLKRRILQYYEKGERDGERVEIPKTVRLACYALAQGCRDYAGPNDKASAGAGMPPREGGSAEERDTLAPGAAAASD